MNFTQVKTPDRSPPEVLADLTRAHRERLARTKTYYAYAIDARNHWMRILAAHNDRVLIDQEPAETFLPDLVLTDLLRHQVEAPWILPVFVLDGISPAQKADALQTRRSRKASRAQLVQEKLQEAECAPTRELQIALMIEARRACAGATRLNHQAQDAVVRRLQEAGYPVHQAPGEAEAQAAAWAQGGHVRAVGSRDFDAFLFGAPRVVRNWPTSTGYQSLADILQAAHANNLDELVCAHILAGKTDYAAPAPGIQGVEHALRLIQAWGFAGVLDRLTPETRAVHEAAHEAYRRPNVEPTCPTFAWGFLA